MNMEPELPENQPGELVLSRKRIDAVQVEILSSSRRAIRKWVGEAG
jgi:hypothetical protein